MAKSVAIWALGLPVVLVTACESVAQPAALVGYDPSGQIRFTTPAEADAKRQELSDFIWSDGLPTTALPTVVSGISFPGDLGGVTQSLVSKVDRLVFSTNVADHELSGYAYMMSPTTPAATPRLGIVHQGHQGQLIDGIDLTINHLLGEGFHVVAMQMPLVGWNSTTALRTMTLPGGSTTTFDLVSSGGHNRMFNQLSGTLDGGTFAYFLEPVVQSVNHFVDENPGGVRDITMIGLSGGGWATHMSAAVDSRIGLSIAVAGSLPLYARPYSPGSAGDAEQFYAPLYREIDSGDGDTIPDTADGVASWLEIYALGGYGQGRRQVQVLNLYDGCCFGGTAFESYDDFVSDKVDSLGQGDWDLVSDTSHSSHMISPFTVNTVLAPAIEIPEPAALTWDGADTGQWTDVHWNPGPVAPAGGEAMLVDSGAVTISSDLAARPCASLAVASGAPGGTVTIDAVGKLAVTGNVTVGAGGALRIDGVLSAGAVAVTGGSLANSAGRAGPMTVDGSVALAGGATLVVDAIGSELDKLVSTDTVSLDTDVTLDIVVSGGGNEFAPGSYTLIDAEGGMSGTFANVTDLGAYVSVNGDGLTYDEPAGTVTLSLDKNLNPGDGNLDGRTDVSDRIIWNNNNFTFGTTFQTGDYNGDGRTDVSDRIIWNNNNFTFATATPGPPGATRVPIPEPATLALLALGSVVLARRRRCVNK